MEPSGLTRDSYHGQGGREAEGKSDCDGMVYLLALEWDVGHWAATTVTLACGMERMRLNEKVLND